MKFFRGWLTQEQKDKLTESIFKQFVTERFKQKKG